MAISCFWKKESQIWELVISKEYGLVDCVVCGNGYAAPGTTHIKQHLSRCVSSDLLDKLNKNTEVKISFAAIKILLETISKHKNQIKSLLSASTTLTENLLFVKQCIVYQQSIKSVIQQALNVRDALGSTSIFLFFIILIFYI